MTLHLIATAVPEWHEQANCAGSDTAEFYPDKGSAARTAKRICSRCDVRTECLEWALARPAEPGVWGGKTEAERRAIRRDGQAGQVAA